MTETPAITVLFVADPGTPPITPLWTDETTKLPPVGATVAAWSGVRYVVTKKVRDDYIEIDGMPEGSGRVVALAVRPA